MAILRAHLRRRGGNARSNLLLLFAFIALAAVALEALFLPYFAPGLWSGGAAGHAASVPPHAQHAIAAQQQQRLASHGAAGGDPWFVKRRIGGERRSRTIRDGAKVRRSLFSSSHTLPSFVAAHTAHTHRLPYLYTIQLLGPIPPANPHDDATLATLYRDAPLYLPADKALASTVMDSRASHAPLTVVFDMDETLFATVAGLGNPRFDEVKRFGALYNPHVGDLWGQGHDHEVLRPHAVEFLVECIRRGYRLMIFTASRKRWAVDQLEGLVAKRAFERFVAEDLLPSSPAAVEARRDDVRVWSEVDERERERERERICFWFTLIHCILIFLLLYLLFLFLLTRTAPSRRERLDL